MRTATTTSAQQSQIGRFGEGDSLCSSPASKPVGGQLMNGGTGAASSTLSKTTHNPMLHPPPEKQRTSGHHRGNDSSASTASLTLSADSPEVFSSTKTLSSESPATAAVVIVEGHDEFKQHQHYIAFGANCSSEEPVPSVDNLRSDGKNSGGADAASSHPATGLTSERAHNRIVSQLSLSDMYEDNYYDQNDNHLHVNASPDGGESSDTQIKKEQIEILDSSMASGGGKGETSGLVETPPSSLSLNSPAAVKLIRTAVQLDAAAGMVIVHHAARTALPSAAPYSAASLTNQSSLGGGSVTNRPVLYSAIGSLENPSANSLSKWKERGTSMLMAKQRLDNSVVPGVSAFLIPPPQHINSDARVASENDTSCSRKATTSLIAANAEQYECHDKQTTATDPLLFGNDSTSTMKSGNHGARQPPHNSSSNSGPAAKTVGKQPPSLLRTGDDKVANSKPKKVTISKEADQMKKTLKQARDKKQKKKPIEMFRPSSDAYTPRMGKKKIEYKPAEMRTPVQKMASPMGTLSRPNFRDALRRVAMILHQHVVKIERRFAQRKSSPILQNQLSSSSESRKDTDGLFLESMAEVFSEERFKTPTYRCTMVRVPMARPGMVYGLKQVRTKYEIPSESEIYEFAHQLFKSVQLSSECSIVCLIYVERLMEVAKVPLLATTWRPIFLCGLLLASKVWQDLSSWNVEFASVYPQYSLASINKLELEFLRLVRWDLYIRSSTYAKYYFALRSLVEKPDFRQRYNRMVGGVDSVQASEALKIEKRSTMVKEEALSHLSRSM